MLDSRFMAYTFGEYTDYRRRGGKLQTSGPHSRSLFDIIRNDALD